MPTRSGKDIQPEHLKMNPEQVTKIVQDILGPIMTQLTALRQESQTREEALNTRLANIERSQQGDNVHRRDRNRNHDRNKGHERDDDTDFESKVGNNHRARGRGRNQEDWVLKSVKVEAPSFDGQIDPRAYSDWESDMDHYFEWYEMSDKRKVRFAKMKLVSQA
eukprot:TRINITY_DN13956_c0_g3_i2.p2 TRINITY_DN13956_c0_g3~~TRINITY_DN13956_c0_g3_i2.p2  ORF type:complete len:164 (-),score=18.23 TRINITY_DN13956_c0_g3_i2:397-888(-)